MKHDTELILEDTRLVKHQRSCAEATPHSKQEKVMPFQDSEKLRTHRDGIRVAQDMADDKEYSNTAWWAFKWFVIGGVASSMIQGALRVLLHHWWR